jgi:short-subunit dehydrogenase
VTDVRSRLKRPSLPEAGAGVASPTACLWIIILVIKRPDRNQDLLVVFGGRSEIGGELASLLVDGATVVLAARDPNHLEEESEALRRAGAAAVHTVEFEADNVESHKALVDQICEEHGPISTAILAFGVLSDQARAEADAEYAVAVVQTNCIAQINLLTLIAQQMRGVGCGRIVVFSSIAGVRVHRANYVYGSAKAALDAFASGLARSLRGSGVHLLIVRPGWVIGRMTQGMEPTVIFSSTPKQVARAAASALVKNKRTVWVPRAMLAVAVLPSWMPQFVWRRLNRTGLGGGSDLPRVSRSRFA